MNANKEVNTPLKTIGMASFDARAGLSEAIPPGAERPSRWSITANVPMAAVMALLLLIGQALQLGALPAPGTADLILLGCSFLFASVSFAALVMFISGLLAQHKWDYASAALWTVALTFSTAYFWDHFSYQWLALHLSDSIPLLSQNIGADFQVMPAKLTALVAILGGYVGFLILGTLAGRYFFNRFAAFRIALRARTVLLGLTLAVMGYATEQLVSPYLMTQKVYNARSHVLWELNIGDASGLSRGTKPLYVLNSVQFKQRPGQRAVAEALDAVNPQSVKRPLNVFLFVIDSLRADDINAETAPNLWGLSHGSPVQDYGIAAANCTHISWYSIIDGINPLYWSVVAHQAHSDGAITIRTLKKAGYSINAVSSTLLDYFGFSHSVFGDNLRLADTILDQAAFMAGADDPGEIDGKVISHVTADLDKLETDSRAFYLIMLDAPHHDYTWSNSYRPRFTPFMTKVPLLSSRITSDNVGLLRNRYKNAVNFDDQLVGKVLQKLNDRKLLDNSIIVITGDHGEEFLENGHLVHSSDFDRYQLHVPIIVHLPEGLQLSRDMTVASHSSIFPTIFDAIGLPSDVNGLLDGKSMLAASSTGIAYSAMCSSSSPQRVLVDDGKEKVELEFNGIGKIGTRLFARRMVATTVLDRDYHSVSGDSARQRAKELIERVFDDGVLLQGSR